MHPYFEIIIRSVCVYLFILIAIRITGKNQLSQLNILDLVLILLISNAVQNAMVGNDTSLLGGLIAAASLFLINFILKTFLYKNSTARNLILDKPKILIHHGVIDKDILEHQHITLDELHEAIREHGIDSIQEVSLAVLETDGNISIISERDGQLKKVKYKLKRKHKLTPMN